MTMVAGSACSHDAWYCTLHTTHFALYRYLLLAAVLASVFCCKWHAGCVLAVLYAGCVLAVYCLLYHCCNAVVCLYQVCACASSTGVACPPFPPCPFPPLLCRC